MTDNNDDFFYKRRQAMTINFVKLNNYIIKKT